MNLPTPIKEHTPRKSFPLRRRHVHLSFSLFSSTPRKSLRSYLPLVYVTYVCMLRPYESVCDSKRPLIPFICTTGIRIEGHEWREFLLSSNSTSQYFCSFLMINRLYSIHLSIVISNIIHTQPFYS